MARSAKFETSAFGPRYSLLFFAVECFVERKGLRDMLSVAMGV